MTKFKIDEDLKELETIVKDMERGDLDLDCALERFEEGVALVRRVSVSLKEAELRVRSVTDEGLKDMELPGDHGPQN